ncbi:MAG: hypothetical protein KDL87_20390, partial [Verrucomicrobiae bacterium]|nr:hypothetical protein [Verrucomicrobiae bacterium]
MASVAAIGWAGESIPVDPEFDTLAAADARPGFEALWRHAVLVDRPDSLLIKRVALTGRLQADAVSFSANQGDVDEVAWRRARLGITADFLRNFSILVEGEY